MAAALTAACGFPSVRAQRLVLRLCNARQKNPPLHGSALVDTWSVISVRPSILLKLPARAPAALARYVRDDLEWPSHVGPHRGPWPGRPRMAIEAGEAGQPLARLLGWLRRGGIDARRPGARPGRQARAEAEAVHAGRPAQEIVMEGNVKKTTLGPAASGERSRTGDKRGLQCRHCGCGHFRVTCTHRTAT